MQPAFEGAGIPAGRQSSEREAQPTPDARAQACEGPSDRVGTSSLSSAGYGGTGLEPALAYKFPAGMPLSLSAAELAKRWPEGVSISGAHNVTLLMVSR